MCHEFLLYLHLFVKSSIEHRRRCVYKPVGVQQYFFPFYLSIERMVNIRYPPYHYFRGLLFFIICYKGLHKYLLYFHIIENLGLITFA
jgi:hypothetical protein